MPVVQIMAKEPVRYSVNNGITISEYEPGEFYDVADHVAAGMLKRGWAKLADPRPGRDVEEEPPPPPPPPEPPPQGEPPEPSPEPPAEPPPEPHEKRAKSRR